jgi:sec-independent protein translocase protein TatB
MRVVGYWVGRARGVARQFRSGFDTMVREAELEEMEKRWAAENERIMREHPTPAADLPPAPGIDPPDPVDDIRHDHSQMPVMVERPHVEPAPVDHAPVDVPASDRPGRSEGAAS